MAKRRKGRVRRAVRSAGRGFRGSATAGGAGGLAYLAHEQLARMMPGIMGHRIGGPAAMLLVGHMVGRRFKSAGLGICGAAGYAFGSAMRLTGGLGETQGLQEPGQLSEGAETGYTAEDLYPNLRTRVG